MPSPPPLENFPAPPVVTGGPYDYGVRGAPAHGILEPSGASGEGEPAVLAVCPEDSVDEMIGIRVPDRLRDPAVYLSGTL